MIVANCKQIRQFFPAGRYQCQAYMKKNLSNQNVKSNPGWFKTESAL